MKYNLILLLTLFVLASCSNEYRTVTGVKYDLSKKRELKDSSLQELEQYLILNDSNYSWVDFGKIKAIRLDSNYFSYQIYLKLDDPYDSNLVSEYKPMTELISEDLFESVPVHIFITDSKFETTFSIPFTTEYWKDSFTKYTYQNIICKVDEPLQAPFCYGIIDIFYDAYPEIFERDDTVMIDSKIEDDLFITDISINKTDLDIETLKENLTSYNSLPFKILFNYKTGIIRFRDKEKSNEVFWIFGVKE